MRDGESYIFDGFVAGVAPGSQHTIFAVREVVFRRTESRSEQAIEAGASAGRRLPHWQAISLGHAAPGASAQ